tara:strand:- start:1 stop:357 length:357 start_codon:yes stop_codon:yes gene_type:complete
MGFPCEQVDSKEKNMQVIQGTDEHKVKWRFYSADIACRLISGNQWGIPVEGVHQGTLTTQWRATGSKFGQRIGRDLFFTKDNLVKMGYTVELDRYLINSTYITTLGGTQSLEGANNNG